MNVQVAAGEALVQGDALTTNQGLYYCKLDAVQTGLTVPNSDPTNPRLDQAVLEVLDHTHDGSGLYLARLRVVAGTPNASATIDNRLGAAALPSSALLLS